MKTLVRYAMAAVGPAGAAGAQFLLLLILLRTLPAAEFGTFSFLFVAAILATGIWSALFCAPLLIVMARSGTESEASAVDAVLAANLAGLAIAAALFMALALATGLAPDAALLFAGFAALGLLRWLGRAHAYADGQPSRAMVSDVVYAVVLLVGVATLFLVDIRTTDAAYLVLLVATMSGIAAFGPSFLRIVVRSFGWSALGRYRAVWREHARWALVGVVSTEATINSHAYLVTAVQGPSAFAPIAATQLLIRPVTIALNALQEYERAWLARSIVAGEIADVRITLGHYRMAVVGMTLLAGVAAALLLVIAPRLLFPDIYPLETLVICTASWFAVMLVRALRAPESTLLQAAGAFRPLAMASVYSALFSIVGVLTVLLLDMSVWSIAGVLTGELLFLYWVWRTGDLWLRANGPTTPVGARGYGDA